MLEEDPVRPGTVGNGGRQLLLSEPGRELLMFQVGARIDDAAQVVGQSIDELPHRVRVAE